MGLPFDDLEAAHRGRSAQGVDGGLEHTHHTITRTHAPRIIFTLISFQRAGR
jgi:hypothetical protein